MSETGAEQIAALQKSIDDLDVQVSQLKAIRALDRTIGTAVTLIVTTASVIVCALQVLDWFGYLVLILWGAANLLWVRPFEPPRKAKR